MKESNGGREKKREEERWREGEREGGREGGKKEGMEEGQCDTDVVGQGETIQHVHPQGVALIV